MSLPPTHGLSVPVNDHAPLPRERVVDVAGRPAEPQRRRAHADADGAVGPVGPAVRIGARNELAGQHQALLRKIEVEDAVARRRVVRLLEAVRRRERRANRRLLVVLGLAGEDEVVVGDRRLARTHRPAAGDLVERVDGERRRAVGGGQQVGVDTDGRARLELASSQRFVHPVRPDDLFRRGHVARKRVIGKLDDRRRAARNHRRGQLALAEGEDAAALANLVFLRRERHGVIRPALRDVHDLARRRVERERVAVARIGDGVRALDDVQTEIERVAPEDVAHVLAADDDHLEAGFLGDALEPGGAHLARRSDRKPVAGDEERLTAVHARAKIRHEIAERAGLPALVQRVEALGDAVGGRA